MAREEREALDDIWIDLDRPHQTAAKASLEITKLGPIEPLDDQFGQSPPRTVPDALHSAMFGQAAGSSAKQTYALIDAARGVHVTEALEESGLDARCLFNGEALKTLGHVAPWVVRLEEGNAFTRGLFTETDAGWDRWPDEPAIYLRSAESMEDTVNRLRRFTRLQDDSGSWHFFRFWEPFHYHVLAERRAAFPALEALWRNIFAEIDVLVPHVAMRSVIRLSVPGQEPNGRVILTPAIRAELKRAVMYRNMIVAAQDLFELHPAEVARYGNGPPDLWPLLFDFADEVRTVGLSDPELRGRMMLLAFLKYPKPWPAFLELPVWQRIQRSPEQANDLFEDFCARLKHLSTSGPTDLEVWW